MIKKLLLLAIVGAVVFYFSRQPTDLPEDFAGPAATQSQVARDDALADAIAGQQSGIQVSGVGDVSRILSDDGEGDRHQRFILTLDSGDTLLIAHNIDVAPRVDSLEVGDSVSFNGVYEWNDKGGVVHWTHHDPQGQHEPGWLKHRGQTFQ